MIISLIIGLLLGSVAAAFIFQNMDFVIVSFLAWEIEGSLALILLLTLAVGATIAILFFLPDSVTKSFKIVRLENKITALKKELENKKPEVDLEKSKPDTSNL